jgi:hypothetical protein
MPPIFCVYKITLKNFISKWVEISHTFVCNNSKIEPMFCKNIIDLQNHHTTMSPLLFRKPPNGYMTRFTLVIQKIKLKIYILIFALDVHKSKLTMQEL